MTDAIESLALAPIAHLDPFIVMVERASRDPSVDIGKFERLVAMAERREASIALERFNDAVSKAKGEIGPILKNRVVDFVSKRTDGRTNYRHEDMGQIAKTIDPVLARHGLSYRYRSQQEGARVKITCILSLGKHSEETTLEAGNDTSGNKNDHQAVGSAATYLQRYTLKIALGLAASNDDDGRSAGVEAPQVISAEELEHLRKELASMNIAEAEALKLTKAESMEAMTTVQYKFVLDEIKFTRQYNARQQGKKGGEVK